MGSITSSLICLVAGIPGFCWASPPALACQYPSLSPSQLHPHLAAPGWRVPLKRTHTHTPLANRALSTCECSSLVIGKLASLPSRPTRGRARDVETTALPAFQQSIIIPSLPGSHHQVIPLLIKILQPLITQPIIAVFISPGLAVQALGGPRILFLGWAVVMLSSYIFTHTSSARSPPWASTLGQEGPTSATWGPSSAPSILQGRRPALHSPETGPQDAAPGNTAG